MENKLLPKIQNIHAKEDQQKMQMRLGEDPSYHELPLVHYLQTRGRETIENGHSNMCF